MAYALEIGKRYLRSRKQSTISVITVIAVSGVALGVAALLTVLSITSGFQKEFRDKVLGVNAHVLVLKYGVDFDEYHDVMNTVRAMPEVAGVGPFLINEMMLANGDRLGGVLVKGIDPELMPEVLDLPTQIIDGSLRGMRREGAHAPTQPDNLQNEGNSDWDWLDELRDDEGETNDAPIEAGDVSDDELLERIANGEPLVDELEPEEADPGALDYEPLPDVDVPSPEEVEALLEGFTDEDLGLPSEEIEAQLIAEDQELEQRAEEVARLPGIVVGTTLAKNLGLGVGDQVKLVSPLTGVDISMFAGGSRAPRSRDFRVIGIFEAGFQEYDSRLVYVDLYEAQGFYDRGDSVTGVEMRMHDLATSSDVAKRIEDELGGPFHTLDWAELNRNLFTALEIQKVMLSLVIATIIFVAAFNVIATLIMIVIEKKREIAILKAMGATDQTVLGVFMVQGVVIGVIGTAIGLLLGGGVVGYLARYEFELDPKVYLIDHVPVVVSPTEFLITIVVALLICSVATLVPSWWAARMLPVDGLRYE